MENDLIENYFFVMFSTEKERNIQIAKINQRYYFERKKVFFRMSYVPLINAFAKQCPTWFLKVYESLAKSKTGTLYNSSIKALHHKYVEKTRWCIKKVCSTTSHLWLQKRLNQLEILSQKNTFKQKIWDDNLSLTKNIT